MATLTSTLPLPAPNIRPFDINRDLSPVADLIDLCFAETLDADGRRYLRQMRAAARNSNFLRWANRVGDQLSMPMSGFVWEDRGKLIGNLSLIPFNSWRRRVFLIANVAVHPLFRRQGIGRALTQAALQAVRLRGAGLPWLQVRQENAGAFDLYRQLGFVERLRRTTWHATGGGESLPPVEGVTLENRRSKDWVQQRAWFLHNYPPEMHWHMPVELSLFDPGLMGWLQRLMNGTFFRHWSVRRAGRLLGVLTWQGTHTFADSLWLHTSPQYDDEVIRSLLPYAQRRLGARRPLALDYPAGRGAAAFEAVGMHTHQTLIWMQAARWE